MIRARALAPLLASAAGALAFVPSAAALDQLRPRVAVEFGEVDCMQRVRRDPNTPWHFDWTIEREDAPIPGEEDPSWRSLQFLAIARQAPSGPLPAWTTRAELEEIRALDPSLGEVPPEEIWEESPAWPPGSWFRLVPDDARLAISFANAEAGLELDPSRLPAGTYQIVGYTYDPPTNISTRREGLVKLVDALDEDGAPALYLEPRPESELRVREGQSLRVPACLDAAPGTSLRVFAALQIFDAPLDFEELAFVPELPARGQGTIELRFPVGTGALPSARYELRVDLEDPEGRAYSAYAPRVILVDEDPDAPPPDSPPAGCGCHLQPTPAGAWIALLALACWRRTSF